MTLLLNRSTVEACCAENRDTTFTTADDSAPALPRGSSSSMIPSAWGGAARIASVGHEDQEAISR